MHDTANLVIAIMVISLHLAYCLDEECSYETPFSNETIYYKAIYDYGDLSAINESSIAPYLEVLPIDGAFISRSKSNVYVQYGESIKILCSGFDAATLRIKKDGRILLTANRDEARIQWLVEKTDIKKSEYVCIDNKTNKSSAVIVSVTPALHVLSAENPKVQKDSFDKKYYTITYGNSVSVLCSGPDASRLVMSINRQKLNTELLDSHTIKYHIDNADLQISEYTCTDVDAGIYNSVVIKVVPRIYVQLRNETIAPHAPDDGDDRNYNLDYTTDNYLIKYDELPVEVICSGARARLISSPDNDDNEIYESVNENTVKMIKNLTAAMTDFSCMDSHFPDYMSTVHVLIIPRMNVISPSIRRSLDRYIIKRGDQFDVFCSWFNASRLKISMDLRSRKVTNILVNETTIKYIEREPQNKNEFEEYYCYKTKGDNNYRNAQIETMAFITVGVLPAEIEDFHCVSYNLEYLNCTWKVSEDNFTNLTLTDSENGLTCLKSSWRMSEETKDCVWTVHKDVKIFSFFVQSCNRIGCSNQTFKVDHISIVQLRPPPDLRINSTSSRGAVLYWNVTLIFLAEDVFRSHYSYDIDHKVVYWYWGTTPVEASSLVTCEYPICEVELSLPCPGQFYEIRVYHKLKQTSDEFWSEPSVVSFYTANENSKTDGVDSTCSSEPRLTKDVMIHEIQKFRRKFQRTELPPITKKVDLLKEKLSRVESMN